jgi:GNAT superfamily N-acetyltransferase
MHQIKSASAEDIDKLIPALLQLRPHRSPSELRSMLLALFKEEFKIIYIGDDRLAWSLLGFRIFNCLWSGKTLYIDDLVTLSAHSKKGYAGSLFQWIKQHAKENHCDHIALNSGFNRRDAYRFYLNQGLFVESLHFGRRMIEL